MELELRSPMQATVREILVKANDVISAGQEVLIVEAMKMEVPVEADCAGVVDRIAVAVDQHILEGQVLLYVRS